ncbi:Plastocyanin-like protein [Corchorus olitorius]|uniref:Basic blue protein n=1 Tax=Corchorus olitorius TaxID=93759 RepID=A0A1R3K2X8_9ROSI|nr:Plastocyanin-like protein [Corchorus olitorius]
MAVERGSAVIGMALIMLSLILLHSENTDAATFKVGDASGWRFGVSNWPNGKNFTAGDILEFTYTQGMHTVAVVDKNGHDTCTVPSGAQIFRTGNDNVTLVKGENYFICSVPGHCAMGMQLAINAS